MALTEVLKTEWTDIEAGQVEPLLTTQRLETVLRVAAARACVDAEEAPMTIAESTRPTVALFAGEPWT